MKKKILVWAGWYPEEEQSLDGLFIKKHIELIGEDNIVHVFTISHKTKKVKWFTSELRTEAFGTLRIYHVPSYIFLRLIGYMLIPLIEGIRSKDRFDIFHLHASVPFSLFTYGLEFCFIKKWVLTEHWSGFTTYSGKFDRLPALQKHLLRKRIKRFNGVSLVSKGLQAEMTKRNLLPSKRYIIPNRLKFSTLTPVKKEQNNFSFCTLSRIDDRHKNISGLLSAFKLVVSENKNVILNVYGDGPDRETLVNTSEKLGMLNKNVFFKGIVNNDKISEVYTKHDAFVMFSNFETYSIATAEALTHGIPVIATACGGPEFFVNETNGIVINVGDIRGCADAMMQLIKKRHEFSSEKIIEHMKIHFSDIAIKSGFEKLYSLS